MMVLPIVERELRAAARRPVIYWSRMLAAGGGLALAGWILTVVAQRKSSGQQGADLFESLTWLGLIFALLAGLQTTATALCRERRDGTLGLLFLTDLKGYDVVLGKLAANSLTAIYGLLALLPVLALPLMLGGVTFTLFLHAAALLVNTLFFSLVAGLFVSSLSRDDRNSVAGTLLLIASVTLLVPGIMGAGVRNSGLALVISLPSPVIAGLVLFRGLGGLPADAFKLSLLSLHALSWLLLWAACRRTRAAQTDAVASPGLIRWLEWFRSLRLGPVASRAARRRRLLDVHPLLWLGARERWKPIGLWTVLGTVLSLWLWGFALDRRLMMEEPGVLLCYLTGFVFKIWLATEAAHCFHRDADRAALELLLTTRLRTAEVIHGLRLGLRHLFFGPILGLVAGHGVFLVAQALGRSGNEADFAIKAALLVAGAVVLAVDAWALAWVGAWMAVRHGNTNRAFNATIGRILILPWVLLLAGSSLMALGGHEDWNTPAWWLGGWTAVSVYVDVYWGVRARSGLLFGIRALASEPHLSRARRPLWWRGGVLP